MMSPMHTIVLAPPPHADLDAPGYRIEASARVDLFGAGPLS